MFVVREQRSSRRLVAGTIVAALFAVGAVVGVGAPASAAIPGIAPIEQRNAATVTADPLPTVQIDSGIVWAQVINGSTVYAGGSFSNARPAGAAAGTSLMPRSNILAYNINTGVATNFAPVIEGTVKSLALSPDGSRLYVGGTFTKVNGQTRFNVAAFDTASGALLESFKPAIGGSYVNAIVATNSAVYFGGLIGAATGVTRKNLAAVSTTGALLGWAPTTDLQVDTMVMSPTNDKLIVGGRFETINGATSRGLGALDLTTGALLPWAVTATVRNGLATGSLAGRAGISTLTTDSTGAVYGTGWVYANTSVGNLEGLFAAEADTGAVRWIADCHGDHYGVYSDGTNVYSTSHEHDCQTAGGLPQGSGTPGNLRHATIYTAQAKGTLTRSPYVGNTYADWSGYPAPAAVNWYPDWTTGTASGQGQAGWTVTGNGQYVVVGGEFPFVNSQRSQGIARFSTTPSTGAKQAPRLSGDDWVPTAKSVSAGTARVSFAANWDRDDLDLTYELWENGASQPSASGSAKAPFWNRPIQTLSARGLEPGSSHTFYVLAKDGDGNVARSADVTVTVSTAAVSPYADAILDDGAALLWRLGTSNAIGGTDWAGANDAVWAGGASTTTDDALANESNGSALFTGGSTSYGRTANTVPAGSNFAMELWFKTTTSSGGKLIGYGNASTGNSTSYDRHLYMRNNGALVFGVYPGSVKTIQSTATYRDNQWHHAVAQLSATAGMQLFVDGSLVASDPSVTSAQAFTGYWRIGGDAIGSSWTNAPTANYFNGRIDELAIYGKTLTPQQVATHYALGTGVGTPTAAFTTTGADLAWSFNGTTSSAPAGRTITSYAWNFGDGTSGSGSTTSHVYSAAGTYTATLTVTDSAGLTSTASRTIVATAPHEPPVAVIGSTVSGLTASLDGTGSTSTGTSTITGYAWSFGDGDTSTAVSPTHKYDAAGTYTVRLTVTDSTGATSTQASRSVTVTHAKPVAAFSPSTTALMVGVDATSSTASDGATLTYAWNWGDGSPAGSGSNASHTYAAPGTYTVTLTVTDSYGSTDSTAETVAVSAQSYAVRDDFERIVASGWGSAPVGGAWTSATATSVADGLGRMSLNAGQTRALTLTGVSVEDLDATLLLAADKVANGGGLHFNLLVHKSTSGEYRLKVRTLSTGVVTLSLTKLVGTTETTLATKTLAAYTFTAGAKLRLHLESTTTGGTTTLNANVWADGTSEPAGWFLTASDSTAALQAAGQVGVLSYLSGSTTNVPVVLTIDDLNVVDNDGGPGEPHVAPVAVIGSQVSGLSVAFSAAGSQVSGGASLTGYEWSFGDGATSSQASPSHSYAVAGSYPVTLRVTDSTGAVSAVASGSVSVAHAAPVAVFTPTVSGLGVAVDAAGSSASDGASLTYAWNWGDGSAAGSGATASHTYGAAGSYTVTLTVTDSLGASTVVSQSVTVSAESFVAKDDFERSVAAGWGSALTGGAWGTAAGFSVADGVGKISLTAGQTRTNLLTGVSAQNVDARLLFSTDKLANGGGVHFNYLVHKTAAGDYRLKLRVAASGVVTVSLSKVVGTTETILLNRTLTGYTHTAGGKLQLRLQSVTAGGATTLQAKVWADGTAEPAAWLASVSDAQAELQGPGQVGVLAYLSGSTTNTPIGLIVDNLEVR